MARALGSLTLADPPVATEGPAKSGVGSGVAADYSTDIHGKSLERPNG